jgi:ATP-dependent DNA helicase RecQ
MGIDKPNIRLIVHQSLAASLEAYYQQAGRAGRDGRHAHIALLYTPPVQRCYERYAARSERPSCVGDRSNHQCNYNKDSLCDYSHRAHFIHLAYPGVESDVRTIMHVYTLAVEGKRIQASSDGNEEEAQGKKLAIWRLQQLGIINSCTITYGGNSRVDYHVKITNPMRRQDVKDKLGEFLRSTKAVESVDSFLLSACNEYKYHHNRATQSEGDFVREQVELLIRRIYDVFPRQRYDALSEEVRYAQQNEHCRRIILRSTFDGPNQLVDDQYNCQFCDVCVKTLEFEVEEATTPKQSMEKRRLQERLRTIYEKYDHESLVEVTVLSQALGMTRSVYYHAKCHLGSESNSLAALYLAGVLGCAVNQSNSDSLSRLEYGFKEAITQGLASSAALDFLEAGMTIEPVEAIGWYGNVQNGTLEPDVVELILKRIALFGYVDDDMLSRIRNRLDVLKVK